MLSAAIVTIDNIAALRDHFEMDEKIFGRPAPHLEIGQYLVEGYVQDQYRNGMVIRFLDILTEAGFARRYTFDYTDSLYFNPITKIVR